MVYLSLIGSNSDLTSVTASWAQQTGTVAALSFLYPIGSGPTSQTETRNVYPLPYGFLRKASQDPKAGSASFLGAPSNRAYDDWLIEGQYIITREANPIVFRFVRDVVTVQHMDPMFCEGLACAIALAICEPITQSTEKRAGVAGEHKLMMTEARLVNAIEDDAEEAALDDWLACRM